MLLSCERMLVLYPRVWSQSLTDPSGMRLALDSLWSDASAADVLEPVPEEFELNSLSDEIGLTIHDALRMARDTVVSNSRMEKNVLLLALEIADAIDNAQEEGLLIGVDAVHLFLRKEGSCSNTEMNRQILDVGNARSAGTSAVEVDALRAKAATQDISLGLSVD